MITTARAIALTLAAMALGSATVLATDAYLRSLEVRAAEALAAEAQAAERVEAYERLSARHAAYEAEVQVLTDMMIFLGPDRYNK